MSSFAIDPLLKEVERYVEKGDGWAHYDVKLGDAERAALRIDFPTRRLDAVLLVIKFAEKTGHRRDARKIANYASHMLEALDPIERDKRMNDVLELFVRIGAVDAAQDLVPYIEDPKRRGEVVLMEPITPRKSTIVDRKFVA